RVQPCPYHRDKRHAIRPVDSILEQIKKNQKKIEKKKFLIRKRLRSRRSFLIKIRLINRNHQIDKQKEL
uniref:hypothetical protein n=1 Tax=Segatella hominis TaxID=2518605 RepID=UPI00402758D7